MNMLKKGVVLGLCLAMIVTTTGCKPKREEVVVNTVQQGTTGFRIETVDSGINDKHAEQYVENLQAALNQYKYDDIMTFINPSDTRQIPMLKYLKKDNLHNLFKLYLSQLEMEYVRSLSIDGDTYLVIDIHQYDNYYNDFYAETILYDKNSRQEFIDTVNEGMKVYAEEYQKNLEPIMIVQELEHNLSNEIKSYDNERLSKAIEVYKLATAEEVEGILFNIKKDIAEMLPELENPEDEYDVAPMMSNAGIYNSIIKEIYSLGDEPDLSNYVFDPEYLAEVAERKAEEAAKAEEEKNNKGKKDKLEKEEVEAETPSEETEDEFDPEELEFMNNTEGENSFNIPKETYHEGVDYNDGKQISEWVAKLSKSMESKSIPKITSTVMARLEQGSTSTYISFTDQDLIKILGNAPVFHSLDKKYRIETYDVWWSYLQSEDILRTYGDRVYQEWDLMDAMNDDDFKQYVVNMSLMSPNLIQNGKIFGKYYLNDNLSTIRKVISPDSMELACSAWYEYNDGMTYYATMFAVPECREFIDTFSGSVSYELIKQIGKNYQLIASVPDVNSIVAKNQLEGLSGLEMLSSITEVIKNGNFATTNVYTNIELARTDNLLGMRIISDPLYNAIKDSVHPSIYEKCGMLLPYEAKIESDGSLMFNGVDLLELRLQRSGHDGTNELDTSAESSSEGNIISDIIDSFKDLESSDTVDESGNEPTEESEGESTESSEGESTEESTEE